MTAKHSVTQSSATESTPFGRVEIHRWGEGGRPLVLLHAAATGPRAFGPLAERLAAAGRTCLAPALHGYGESRVDGAASPIDGHLAIARWAVESSGAEALFGHSMGGLVGLLAAGGAGVRQLVLFEPILFAALDAVADGPLIDAERVMTETMERHLAAGRDEAAVRAFVEPWNDAAWPDLPEGLRARLTSQAAAIVAETRATGAVAIAPETWATAPATTLIHGDRSPEIARRMAAGAARLLPEVRIETLSGLGHMGPLTTVSPVAGVTLSALGATS